MRVHHLFVAAAAETTLATALYSNSFGVPGINATYDYVVVGGGTAGLTIAARLAEDLDVSVAVIEAGGFYQQDNGNGRCVVTIMKVQHERQNPLTVHQCHTRLVHNPIRGL
jgi:ribulose 1,5-bisphosphate synthetase/thiazole synthase